jgi:hypothetical protein
MLRAPLGGAGFPLYHLFFKRNQAEAFAMESFRLIAVPGNFFFQKFFS